MLQRDKKPSAYRVKYKSGRLDGVSDKISDFAEGVSTIVYIIFGDRLHLERSIENYLSLLNKNLQLFDGTYVTAEVHSIPTGSIKEINDELSRILKTISEYENLCVLIDECYHNIPEYLFDENIFAFVKFVG